MGQRSYVVIKKNNLDIPVFVMQKENGEGNERTLHKNHLLPIGNLPGPEQTSVKKRPTPAPRLMIIQIPTASDTEESEH